jgi:hypothetical protein
LKPETHLVTDADEVRHRVARQVGISLTRTKFRIGHHLAEILSKLHRRVRCVCELEEAAHVRNEPAVPHTLAAALHAGLIHDLLHAQARKDSQHEGDVVERPTLNRARELLQG